MSVKSLRHRFQRQPASKEEEATPPAAPAVAPASLPDSVEVIIGGQRMVLKAGVDYAIDGEGGLQLDHDAKCFIIGAIASTHRVNFGEAPVPWGVKSGVKNERISPLPKGHNVPKRGMNVVVRGIATFMGEKEWQGRQFREYAIRTSEGDYTFADWGKKLVKGSAIQVEGEVGYYKAARKAVGITPARPRILSIKKARWKALE